MPGMKATDHTSPRCNLTTPPPARWYRVRPALLWTLALGVTVQAGLAGYALALGLRREELMETATRLALQYGSPVLTVLAVLSVAAVIVQDVRTTRRLPKLVRSLRITQRLQPGSRTARA